MRKSTVYKLIIAATLLIFTIIFAVQDNEAVFPATLVGFFLVLTLFGTEDLRRTAAGKAAQYAIITFSMLVIALNVLVTIFLPILAASSDISGYSVELTTSIGTSNTHAVADHFVAVTVNDMHELCYSTSILLLLNSMFMYLLNRKRTTAH